MAVLHTSTVLRSADAPYGVLAATVSSVGPRAGATSLTVVAERDEPLGTPSALPVLQHRRVVAVSTVAGSVPGGVRAADDESGPSVRADGPDVDAGSLPQSRSAERTDQADQADQPRGPGKAGASLLDELVAAEPPSGQRRNLADSRRLGLGPAYHGSLPEAMRAEQARHREIADPVDPTVRAAVERATAVDLGEPLVHRGPSVTAEARDRGALAFARGGQVYVSTDADRLDTAAGRALVAHELTHAAQQRTTGVADESGPAGLALEAQARRVEQFVRGDADAALPAPALLHRVVAAEPHDSSDDAVAEARTMMRELVAAGLADDDGDGGITIIHPAVRGAGEPAQRSVGAPPTARSATAQGEAAREQNWNPLDTFGHHLASSFSHDMLGMAGSLAGFSDEFAAENAEVLDETDREFARDQTREAFRTLRLEHRTSARLTELNRENLGDDRQELQQLPADELERIRGAVAADVEFRMERLGTEAAAATAQINHDRAAGAPAVTEVPARDYDAAFHLLFDDPDQADPPSAEIVVAALSRSARAAPRSGRPGSPVAAAAAASTATPHPAAPTSATTPPTATATATSTGFTATHGPGPATAGARDHGADHVWHADRDATVGENLRTAAVSAGFDVVGGFAGLGASLFGFSSGTSEELSGSIEQDRVEALGHSGHPDATVTGSPTPSSAATSAVATPPTAESAAGSTAPAPARSLIGGHPEAERRTTASGAEALDLAHIDLAELAGRIYPDISSRLRHELLLDRERAGLLADFR